MVLESVRKTWFLYTHDGPLNSAVDLVMLLAGATNLSSLLNPGTTPGRVWVGTFNGKGRRMVGQITPSPPFTATFSGSIHILLHNQFREMLLWNSSQSAFHSESPHCLAKQEELILWSHHQGAAGTSHSINLLRLQGGDLVVTSYLSQSSPNQALASPQSTPPLGSGDKLKELTHPLTASFAKVNVTTSFTCNKLLECVYWRADKYTDDGCHWCNQRTLKCSLKSAIQPKLADFGL